MISQQQALTTVTQEIKEHTCSLRPGCTQAVPGDGSASSEIVFIGEAPGRYEDQAGRPFVGRARKLLDELLASIHLSRSDVYITNVVKCRPPENRDPSPSEVAEHSNFLKTELDIIKPRLIVLLGRHALNRFIPDAQISQLRGQAKRIGGQVYLALYHPAAALRNPAFAEALKSDFKKIPTLLSKIKELPPAPPKKPEATYQQSTMF